ncbi:MAG: FMN reductase [Melioribacteraceae bacterium]|nr:MAG: FMN reductase [Melioribacteraceae bacterium]
MKGLVMKQMSIAVIIGSVREGNNSLKIGKAVLRYLKEYGVNGFIINPVNFMLPFPGEKVQGSDTTYLQELVKNADGAIFVTPEYNGSISSIMKLIIENLGYPSTLKGKPSAIVGVTAGKFGAVKPMEHLRGILTHTGSYVLPLQVSVSNVYEMIDVQGFLKDDETRERLKTLTNAFIDFSQKFADEKSGLRNFNLGNSVMN